MDFKWVLKKYKFNNSWIFFIWLSHKLWKNWEILDAFCNSTNSWKIINKIIINTNNKNIDKLNLVNWVPLDEKWKIRYPNSKEKEIWLELLLKNIEEFQPYLIFLFWKEVSNFIFKNIDIIKINENEYKYMNSKIILVDHPSYVFIYKKRYLNDYINNICQIINRYKN